MKNDDSCVHFDMYILLRGIQFAISGSSDDMWLHIMLDTMICFFKLSAPSDEIYTYHDTYHECFGVMIHIWSSTEE